jgi:hypothetical protein
LEPPPKVPGAAAAWQAASLAVILLAPLLLLAPLPLPPAAQT